MSLDQLRHFTVQFSVFSNQFLLAALNRVINADRLEAVQESKEMLMNELGVIYADAERPRSGARPADAEREGDPALVSTGHRPRRTVPFPGRAPELVEPAVQDAEARRRAVAVWISIDGRGGGLPGTAGRNVPAAPASGARARSGARMSASAPASASRRRDRPATQRQPRPDTPLRSARTTSPDGSAPASPARHSIRRIRREASPCLACC